MKRLTDRQQEAYDFIMLHYNRKRKGKPHKATLHEIGQHIGGSRQYAFLVVKALIYKGKLIKHNGEIFKRI